MKSLLTLTMTKEEPRSLASFFKNFWCKLKKSNNEGRLRETIEELIDEVHEVEHIESNEREILGNVLNLRDLTAYDVMLPRADIIAAPFNVSAQDIIQQFVKTGVLQILIYKDNLDNVIGMLHVKDILAWQSSKKAWVIKALLRDVLYISPTMRTLDLLLKMRETGSKIAVVVDEYGGVDGLVTFSNLIEEIIGDIQDAGEQPPSVQIELRPDGTIIADARTTLEELNKAIGAELPLNDHEDDVDTLGGVVALLAGRVPIRGEVVRHPSGIEFEVLEADPRKVRRLCIRHKS